MTFSLNPNAPPFIPGAFQKVEEFSPEWYALVKENPAFSNYWLRASLDMFEDGCKLSPSDLDELDAAEELAWQQRELDALEQAEEAERGCQQGVGSYSAEEKRLMRRLLGQAMKPSHEGHGVAAFEKSPRYVRGNIPRVHAQRIQQPRA